MVRNERRKYDDVMFGEMNGGIHIAVVVAVIVVVVIIVIIIRPIFCSHF